MCILFWLTWGGARMGLIMDAGEFSGGNAENPMGSMSTEEALMDVADPDNGLI